MLSICVTVKNRSRVTVNGRELYLFPNCVRSIVAAVERSCDSELVIADFQSNDWPLDQWLQDLTHSVKVQVLTIEEPFSRGVGLNAASSKAQGDVLFFVDADTVMTSSFLLSATNHVRVGNAYFPVVFAYDTPDHRSGRWADGGYGHCMINRSAFEQAGRWPEFTSYGQEDEDLFAQVSRMTRVVRDRAAGLYHQWHPNTLEWKNRYGTGHPRLGREGEKMSRACKRLSNLIPAQSTFILVDESQFCIPQPPLERAVPFLERHGIYWGLPADDTTAIREVNRLRGQGVGFIAFAWMSFWWLEYYAELNVFLRTQFRCVFEGSDLIIFDLQRMTNSVDQATRSGREQLGGS